jgi:hypothetical protein
MPRPLREFVPGAYYHHVTRGVNGLVTENPLRARLVLRVDDRAWCGFAAPTAGSVVGSAL